jgi:hypothetical protein
MNKTLKNRTKKELLEIISNMKKKDLIHIIENKYGGYEELIKETGKKYWSDVKQEIKKL